MRSFVKALIFSLLLAFVFSSSLHAQGGTKAASPFDRWWMMWGVYGGYGINSLSGNLSAAELPGVIPGNGECGSFQEGSGAGILGGLLFDYRLSSILSGGLRLEYSDRSGQMAYRCVDPAQIRLPDGSLTAAETEHQADIALNALSLHLLLGGRPFAVPLLFSAGPSISFLGGDYRLTEQVVAPTTAEFVSGGQTREYGNGTFAEEEAGPRVGLLASLGYELPVGEAWLLRPEVSVALPLSNDVTLGGVRSTGFRFSLGVVQVFASEPPVEVIPASDPVAVDVQPPPSTISRKPLRATIEVNNGSGWTEGPLVIRRFTAIRTRLVPLLPYVFFDNRLDDLPARYVRISSNTTGQFREANFASHTNLDVYSHVLNIVGSRMRTYPDAELTLTGTAPDVAEGNPSTAMARSRAESIRGYLNSTWGISKERMRIVPRRDPEVPTNPETSEGRAENRRVEMSSNRIEILAPLAFTDTLAPIDKGQARLLLEGENEQVTAWKLEARGNSGIKNVDETGPLPHRYERLLPPLESFVDNDSLIVTMQVLYGDGSIEEPLASTAVVRDITYKPLIGSGEYSLILFDAANDALREEHRRVIDSIAAMLPDDAVVSIYGYTDYLGDSTENQSLSNRRARQVAERFRMKGATVREVQGLGEDTTTFNVLGLPEERMYARRVVIEVRQPDGD